MTKKNNDFFKWIKETREKVAKDDVLREKARKEKESKKLVQLRIYQRTKERIANIAKQYDLTIVELLDEVFKK